MPVTASVLIQPLTTQTWQGRMTYWPEDEAQTIPAACKNVEKVQQRPILEVKTRIVSASADDRDYEHRPDHPGDDYAALYAFLQKMARSRKKP